MTFLEQPTDEQLIAAAATGDFDTFQELVRRFQGRVFGLAFRITRHRADAEDVTQQTFLSLIEHIRSFRGAASAAGWILRIATNHALKLLRKRRGLPTVSWERTDRDDDYASLPHPDFIAQWKDSPEELAQRAEVHETIEQALSQLDDKYRLVFALRDVEGLSVSETAEAMGITESNVKVRLLRARLLLRERLTREFGDESTRVFPDHDHNG